MLKKRTLTLIEVLISMVLLTILLGTLFSWYFHMTQKKNTLEKIKYAYMELRCAQQRLDKVMAQVKPPFYTEDGLVFRFDRGLYADSRLSNTVLGKLYHDPHLNTLCLGVWPDPKEDIRVPSQTLTILDHVTTCSYAFYSPPNPFKRPVDSQEVGRIQPHSGWQQMWDPRYEHLPALICITLTHRGKEQRLFFDLNQPIIYPMETG